MASHDRQASGAADLIRENIRDHAALTDSSPPFTASKLLEAKLLLAPCLLVSKVFCRSFSKSSLLLCSLGLRNGDIKQLVEHWFNIQQDFNCEAP